MSAFFADRPSGRPGLAVFLNAGDPPLDVLRELPGHRVFHPLPAQWRYASIHSAPMGGGELIVPDPLRRDRPSLMPAYGSIMSQKEIEDVVAYLSSLRSAP